MKKNAKHKAIPDAKNEPNNAIRDESVRYEKRLRIFRGIIRSMGVIILLLSIGLIGFLGYSLFLKTIGVWTFITPFILAVFGVIGGIYLMLLNHLGRLLLTGLLFVFFIHFIIWTITSDRFSEEFLSTTLLLSAILVALLVLQALFFSRKSIKDVFSKLPKRKVTPFPESLDVFDEIESEKTNQKQD